jgi:hypothetical protein
MGQLNELVEEQRISTCSLVEVIDEKGSALSVEGMLQELLDLVAGERRELHRADMRHVSEVAQEILERTGTGLGVAIGRYGEDCRVCEFAMQKAEKEERADVRTMDVIDEE